MNGPTPQMELESLIFILCVSCDCVPSVHNSVLYVIAFPLFIVYVSYVVVCASLQMLCSVQMLFFLSVGM